MNSRHVQVQHFNTILLQLFVFKTKELINITSIDLKILQLQSQALKT